MLKGCWLGQLLWFALCNECDYVYSIAFKIWASYFQIITDFYQTYGAWVDTDLNTITALNSAKLVYNCVR